MDPGRSAVLTVGARLREAASHTIVYGLGSVLQSLLGFVLIPLYTRYFTPEVYGVFTLVTLAGTVAGAVFFLGGASALARSYYDYESVDDRRRVVTTSLAITLAGALVQILLALLVARPLSSRLFGSDQYSAHIVVAMAASAVTFVNTLFYVILRFERRSTLVVVLNLTGLAGSTALILLLLTAFDLGVMAPILGGLIAQSALLAVMAYACRRAMAPAISSHELRVQLRFGLTAVIIGLGYYVLDSIDRVFIARYASLTDVGVYSLGYKLGMVIHIVFILPFSQIWAPMRMQYRDDPSSRDLFRVVLTYYWILGLLATVAISLFAREIVAVAAGGGAYIAAYRVVPLVMLAHLFYGSINIVDYGVYVSRKVQYHAYLFWSAVVVNSGLNWLLIPRYGYMAAAWTTLATYVAVAVGMLVMSNRFYLFPVDARRLTLVLASGIAVLWAGAVLPASAISLVVKTATLAALVAFWYVAVLTTDERAMLRPRALLRAF
jgi:O-antigen/teichoic acid export membrane protein